MYTIVNRRPVFFSDRRWYALKKAVFNSGDDIADSLEISGADMFSSSRRKLEKRGLAYLKRRQAAEPAAFERDWVRFRFEGDELNRELSALLADYCFLKRTTAVWTLEDKFVFSAALPIHLGLIRMSYVPRGSLSLTFNATDVLEAEGTLEDFHLRASKWSLHCGARPALHVASSAVGDQGS